MRTAQADLAVEVLDERLVLDGERLGDRALSVQPAQQLEALVGQLVDVLLQRPELRAAAAATPRAGACMPAPSCLRRPSTSLVPS